MDDGNEPSVKRTQLVFIIDQRIKAHDAFEGNRGINSAQISIEKERLITVRRWALGKVIFVTPPVELQCRGKPPKFTEHNYE